MFVIPFFEIGPVTWKNFYLLSWLTLHSESPFSEKAQRPLSNDYYILSVVSCFILSHTKLIHFGAATILQKIPPKNHDTAILFPPFLSHSIYISYLYPAFGTQFINEFISKSI